MATIHRFEDLDVGKLARALHLQVFMLTKKETLQHDYELTNQMGRSAGSVMDNIAEGFGRASRLEFVQF
jgi:four helix bundle protein